MHAPPLASSIRSECAKTTVSSDAKQPGPKRLLDVKKVEVSEGRDDGVLIGIIPLSFVLEHGPAIAEEVAAVATMENIYHCIVVSASKGLVCLQLNLGCQSLSFLGLLLTSVHPVAPQLRRTPPDHNKKNPKNQWPLGGGLPAAWTPRPFRVSSGRKLVAASLRGDVKPSLPDPGT